MKYQISPASMLKRAQMVLGFVLCCTLIACTFENEWARINKDVEESSAKVDSLTLSVLQLQMKLDSIMGEPNPISPAEKEEIIKSLNARKRNLYR